ncbi:MAG: 7TM domain-containing protein [bacterium]
MDVVAQHFINYLSTDKAIAEQTLILILMLPIIAMLVVSARHILGLKSFGMYVPIIATYALATLGFKIGLVLILYLAAIGLVTRYSISILRIHYLSRLSLVIGVSTIASLVFIYILTIIDPLAAYAQQGALSIVLVISFAETFVSTEIQKGSRTALYLFAETIVIAVLGSLLIRWDFMRNLLLDFPYIIIVTILLNVIIGKWKGLRLSEMWRFRTIKKSTIKKV